VGVATAYVGLGSNLGDRAAHIYLAIDKLHALPGTGVVKTSGLYESAAVDSPVGAGAYLNAVAELATELTPHELLRQLQSIEATLGRTRPAGVHNAPRTIDLDLLAHGQQVIDEQRLTVPHPRLQHRSFVLAPLAEIAPDWRHPRLKKTAAVLLAEATDKRPIAVARAAFDRGRSIAVNGLSLFDRICGGLGVLGCGAVSLLLAIGLIATLDRPGQATAVFLFLAAWCWLGTYGVVRYHLAAERLEKQRKAGDLGDFVGHGFSVLKAEVVDAEEVRPDDRGDAGRSDSRGDAGGQG